MAFFVITKASKKEEKKQTQKIEYLSVRAKRNLHREHLSVISVKNEVATTGAFEFGHIVGSSGEISIDCSTWLGSKKTQGGDVVVLF